MSFNTRSARQSGRGIQQTPFHASPRQAQSFQTAFQSVYSTPLSQPGPLGATSPQPQAQPLALVQQQLQQQPPMQQPQPLQQQSPVSQFKMQQPVTPPGTPITPQVQPQQPQTYVEGGEIPKAEKVDSRDGEEASKPWKKHKNPSFKVNKVLKRRRQNARFRKLLIPKNAIMVLNELQPGVSFDADEQVNAFSQVCYTVRINIDGDTYVGEGSSKAGAKASAAESAVKGLILKKISESSVKKEESIAEDDQMDAASGSGDDASTNGKRNIPEDEVPWGSLASFALFKLFADWKSQGTNIPTVMTPPPSKPIPKVTGTKPPVLKGTIPENPENLHPVTLVGRVFPGTLFSEISREGTPPHLTFYIGTTINDVKHVGVARSKKEAKKNCAIEVLKANNIPYSTTA